jgi:hypothetical protein
MQPGAIASFSVPQQVGAAKISIQNRSIEIEVPKGSDRSALVATFTTTSDATSVLVNETPQVTGVTANNFEAPVTYKVVTADLENSWTVTVTEAVASSKPEYTIQRVEVYPNPFDTYFSISNPGAVKTVTITNLSGQRVSEVNLEGESTVIVKGLKEGVYLIDIELVNGERQVVRMVKK